MAPLSRTNTNNPPSPVPPSSYNPTWRADSAQGFSSLRSDYPSWLPRRPPPPVPASTVGTNTPMPAELGEFGEFGSGGGDNFEQQYRDYLQNTSSPSPGAAGDADISNSTNGGNVNIDTTRASEDASADVDYLRREAQAILERGRPSTTSEDSPGDAIPPAQLGGRKANSRSVRIVNLGQDAVVKGLGVDATIGSRREGTDQTRVASDSGAGAAIGQMHARTHSQSHWYSKKHPKRVSGVSAYSQFGMSCYLLV
jgi:hypothetical protein